MSFQLFSHNLLSWYKKSARELPWRKIRDPYKIWISEVMLQQTTVNAVIPYYERWIKRYPTVFHVAKAPLKTILKSWEGLGYYSRARNLHAASKLIVKNFNGKIPRNPEQVKTLPGFGPYTVGAVLSIAYNLKFPIVDANIRRICMRLLAIKGKADVSVDVKVSPFVESVLPKKNMRDFNQAFMELGALICRRDPQCYACPVKKMCTSYTKGIQEIIPTPKKTVYEDFDVAIGILRKKDKFYIQKRASKGLLAELWEFPGGKRKKGESLQKALIREMKEECGLTIKRSQHFMNAVHFYTNKRVKLYVYFCESEQAPNVDKSHVWVSLTQMKNYPMPSGSVKIADKLKEL